jgi:hypothetical protein
VNAHVNPHPMIGGRADSGAGRGPQRPGRLANCGSACRTGPGLRPGPFKHGGKVLIGEDPPEDIGGYETARRTTPRAGRSWPARQLALAGLSNTRC